MTEEVIKTEAQSEVEAFFSADLNIEMFKESVAANVSAGVLTAFDLPRIKIPLGGVTQWLVQKLDGEVSESAIEGVIILARDTRAYWQTDADAPGATGNNPPDCSSTNALVGIGTPGGNCQDEDPVKICPLAKFGSDPKGGGGQACKQVKQLFFLRTGTMMPALISLPPTSLGPAKRYMVNLMANCVPYYTAVTRLTLRKEKSAGGKYYGVADFKLVRRLSATDVANVLQFQKMVARMVETLGVDTEVAKQA
jgi:hypothetical protein